MKNITKMNKKGMEFKSGLFAIVAVSIIVIAFGTIITEQTSVYGSGATSGLSSYDQLDNISETSGNYRSKISPNDEDPSSDAESNTFRGVYGIMANIFQTFDIVLGDDGMLDDLTVQFGLPSYVRQGVITFIMIAITFSLIAVIFRLARRSA